MIRITPKGVRKLVKIYPQKKLKRKKFIGGCKPRDQKFNRDLKGISIRIDGVYFA